VPSVLLGIAMMVSSSSSSCSSSMGAEASVPAPVAPVCANHL
jgi:hypothetical protein